MPEEQNQKDTSGLTAFELSKLEQFHCQSITSKVLEDTLLEYFEGTFVDCYPTFYKQLSTALDLPTDNSKKYHFYFLVTIDTNQRIFQYRTDRLFRWYYKQSLKDLWTYLKYIHCNNIKVNINAYCIPISDHDYSKINYIFQNVSKKENYLSLFLDWVFKKKLLLLSGSIAFFPLYILGYLYLNINIPFGSIENSFSSYLPIMTNKILIDSLFSWIFLLKVVFPLIIGILFQRNWYFIHLHRQRIIAGIFILFVGMFFYTIKTIPDKDWALKAYIEMTGYPKIVQNKNRYYTLLGTNKAAYDLNKSLTSERCTSFNDTNKSSPPEVYYSLIRKMGNDFDTYPSSAQTLEGNITFFDYNESLNLIKTLCDEKQSK